jgi:uncharacterized protein YabE (DUF348 family)
MSFAVTAGRAYRFRGLIVHRSAATTTGLKVGLTCPAFTVLATNVSIPVAVDGTAAFFHGMITSSGDSVTGTGVPVAAQDNLAVVDGIIIPSASGTVQFQYASEVSGSGVTIRQGTYLNFEDIT